MASSSSNKSCCIQCKEDSSSVSLRNGWKFRTGEYAQLCNRCYYMYDIGLFCESFHSKEDGWRDCAYCGKMIHSGCIVSINEYFLLDLGGVICKACTNSNKSQAQNYCNAGLDAIDDAMNIVEGTLSTDLEMQCISEAPECTLIPLFEKFVTTSDCNSKFGRLVIPKKLAEAYFPEITDPHGILMNILDTDGNVWDVYFRFWNHRNSRMYVLQGLRDFIVSNNLQTGDLVTFYRMEPDGNMVIGLKKISNEKPCTSSDSHIMRGTEEFIEQNDSEAASSLI